MSEDKNQEPNPGEDKSRVTISMEEVLKDAITIAWRDKNDLAVAELNNVKLSDAWSLFQETMQASPATVEILQLTIITAVMRAAINSASNSDKSE